MAEEQKQMTCAEFQSWIPQAYPVLTRSAVFLGTDSKQILTVRIAGVITLV